MKKLIYRLKHLFNPERGDDHLLTLVQVATEDATIRTQLLEILALPAEVRQQHLSTWIKDMEAEGAPPVFVDTIRRLGDPAFAGDLQTYLQQLPDNTRPES